MYWIGYYIKYADVICKACFEPCATAYRSDLLRPTRREVEILARGCVACPKTNLEA